MSKSKKVIVERDANRDPISGEPGAHPVGVGLGAAGGATVGAAVGSVAGPVGVVVGAIGGGVAGGLAGKGVAEEVDPTTEDAYWRENYKTRPYYDSTVAFEEYRPAYHYGCQARHTHAGRPWDDVEPELLEGWERVKGNSKLAWEKVKHAVKDAWSRDDRQPKPR